MNARNRIGERLAHRQHRIVFLESIRLHVEQQRLLVAPVNVRPIHQHAVTHPVARAVELPILHPVVIGAASAIHRQRALVAIRLHFVHGTNARGCATIGGDFHHIRRGQPAEEFFERGTEMPQKRRWIAHAHQIEIVAIVPDLSRAGHAAIIRVPGSCVRQTKVVPDLVGAGFEVPLRVVQPGTACAHICHA